MNWKRSLPAVLLLSLTVPAAKGMVATHSPVATSALRRVREDGASRQSQPSQARPKRRGEGAERETLSETSISQAVEYLRGCAERQHVSNEMRAEWERFYHHCDATIRR